MGKILRRDGTPFLFTDLVNVRLKKQFWSADNMCFKLDYSQSFDVPVSTLDDENANFIECTYLSDPTTEDDIRATGILEVESVNYSTQKASLRFSVKNDVTKKIKDVYKEKYTRLAEYKVFWDKENNTFANWDVIYPYIPMLYPKGIATRPQPANFGIAMRQDNAGTICPSIDVNHFFSLTNFNDKTTDLTPSVYVLCNGYVEDETTGYIDIIESLPDITLLDLVKATQMPYGWTTYVEMTGSGYKLYTSAPDLHSSIQISGFKVTKAGKPVFTAKKNVVKYAEGWTEPLMSVSVDNPLGAEENTFFEIPLNGQATSEVFGDGDKAYSGTIVLPRVDPRTKAKIADRLYFCANSKNVEWTAPTFNLGAGVLVSADNKLIDITEATYNEKSGMWTGKGHAIQRTDNVNGFTSQTFYINWYGGEVFFPVVGSQIPLSGTNADKFTTSTESADWYCRIQKVTAKEVNNTMAITRSTNGTSIESITYNNFVCKVIGGDFTHTIIQRLPMQYFRQATDIVTTTTEYTWEFTPTQTAVTQYRIYLVNTRGTPYIPKLSFSGDSGIYARLTINSVTEITPSIPFADKVTISFSIMPSASARATTARIEMIFFY